MLVATVLAPALAQAAKPGDFDRSFGGDGKVMTDFGSNNFATSVAIDSQERIVAAGRSGGGAQPTADLAAG
jgi:hypothetical protein